MSIAGSPAELRAAVLFQTGRGAERCYCHDSHLNNLLPRCLHHCKTYLTRLLRVAIPYSATTIAEVFRVTLLHETNSCAASGLRHIRDPCKVHVRTRVTRLTAEMMHITTLSTFSNASQHLGPKCYTWALSSPPACFCAGSDWARHTWASPRARAGSSQAPSRSQDAWR